MDSSTKESSVGVSTTGESSYYQQGTLKYSEDPKILISKVEVVIKALGTMVIFPEYSNTEEIGKKVFTGTIQKPILLGKDREDAENKLAFLIKSL